MFSALSKLTKLIWTYDEDEDESTKENHADGNEQLKGSDLYHNANEKRSAVTRNFDGKVTHLFNAHGLINGEIYFSFDAVVGENIPQLGTTVTVVAKQEHAEGGWNAEQVIPTDDFWDREDDFDPCIEDTEPTSIVGIVTQFDGISGIINDNIHFIFEKFDTDDEDADIYVPYKGDYVTADLSKNKDGEMVAENVLPLRRIDKEGSVTGSLQDHGYIDGEVFFSFDTCAAGYTCKKWDKVKYMAVESIQGRNTWRAIFVEPSQTHYTPSARFLLSPTRSTFLEDLQKNKNGIYISGDTDFGSVTINQTKKVTIWVENKGGYPQVFQRCHFPAESSQFHVDSVKLVREHSAMVKLGNQEVTKGEITLYPTVSMYITVSVTGRSAGSEKQLLIVSFKGFRIGRYITANVVDPYSTLVDVGQTYSRQQSKSGFTRYKDTVAMPNGWTIPGERPNRFTRKFLPNRLPQYHVSEQLRDCVLEKEDVREIAPYLMQDLTFDNYRKKFQTLLHLEEIQMEIDIREFDLDRVCFRPIGEYLALKVPGLAEGRPSVLIGDKIVVTDPGDIAGPCYEGYVHELLKDEVLLKFNQDFHNIHNGKDFDVVFTFNRTPMRRCHQASEFAVNLGQNVLFPEVLIPKLSQLSRSSRSSRTQCESIVPVDSANISHGPYMSYFNTSLNNQQKAAVDRILQGQSRPLPYILFGPPGTGKTMTVVEAILQVLKKIPYSRILACAPSNSAADLIADRLQMSGLIKTSDMVRLNAAQRNAEVIPSNIKAYCSFGDNLDLAAHYRVVVCTCISAGLLYALGIKAGHFSHVFVDEAGQATEAEALISACMVAGSDGQIILSGDPMQLGPVLRSAHSKKYGLEVSLLERLIQRPLYARNTSMFADHGCYDPLLVTKLLDNYRSHQAILSLSSHLFYHDELVERADMSLTHFLCGWSMLPNKTFPVVFHGCRGEDMREGNSPSWFNPVETVQVVRYLQGLLQSEKYKVLPEDVGIITPYRKQVEKIRLLIDKLGMDSVKVGSVEEFQGQERQVIIISTVRSNESMIGFDKKHTLGFLSNPKRFNVAISRAQALLIIVGNPFVLAQDRYWQTLIDYCIQNQAYTGCDLPDFTQLEDSEVIVAESAS